MEYVVDFMNQDKSEIVRFDAPVFVGDIVYMRGHDGIHARYVVNDLWHEILGPGSRARTVIVLAPHSTDE